MVLLGSAAVPLSAHHSWPVNLSNLVTVKGTVTEFSWGNPQGTQQLRSLAALRPPRRVLVYDTLTSRAESFAQSVTDELGLPAIVTTSVAAAVGDADVSLIATWSRTPFVLPGMLPAGAHVTTLGVDEPGKAEVDPE